MGLFGPKKKTETPRLSPELSNAAMASVISSPSVSSASKNNSTTPRPIVRRPYLHTQATQERLQPPPIHENEIQILKAQVADLKQCFQNKELFDCLISDVDRNRLTQITMLLAESGDYAKMQSVMDQTEILDKLIVDRLSEKHDNVRRSIQTASSSDSLDKSIDEVISEISALDVALLSVPVLQIKLSYFEYFLFSFQDAADFDKMIILSGKIEEMRKVYLRKSNPDDVPASSSNEKVAQPEEITVLPSQEQEPDNSMYAAFPDPPVLAPLVNLEHASLLFTKISRAALANAFGFWVAQNSIGSASSSIIESLRQRALTRLMLEWRLLALAQSYHTGKLRTRVIYSLRSQLTSTTQLVDDSNLKKNRTILAAWSGVMTASKLRRAKLKASTTALIDACKIKQCEEVMTAWFGVVTAGKMRQTEIDASTTALIGASAIKSSDAILTAWLEVVTTAKLRQKELDAFAAELLHASNLRLSEAIMTAWLEAATATKLKQAQLDATTTSLVGKSNLQLSDDIMTAWLGVVTAANLRQMQLDASTTALVDTCATRQSEKVLTAWLEVVTAAKLRETLLNTSTTALIGISNSKLSDAVLTAWLGVVTTTKLSQTHLDATTTTLIDASKLKLFDTIMSTWFGVVTAAKLRQTELEASATAIMGGSTMKMSAAILSAWLGVVKAGKLRQTELDASTTALLDASNLRLSEAIVTAWLKVVTDTKLRHRQLDATTVSVIGKTNLNQIDAIMTTWLGVVTATKLQHAQQSATALVALDKANSRKSREIISAWDGIAKSSASERLCIVDALTSKVRVTLIARVLSGWSHLTASIVSANLARGRSVCKHVMLAWMESVQRMRTIRTKKLQEAFVAWLLLSRAVSMQMVHETRRLVGPVMSAWQSHSTQMPNNLFGFSISCNERIVARVFLEWKSMRSRERRSVSPVRMSASPISDKWMEIADSRKHKVEALQEAIRRKKLKDALDYLTDQTTRSRLVSPTHIASTPPVPDSSDSMQPRKIEHYYIDDDAQVPPVKPRTAEEIRKSTEKLIIRTQVFLSRTRLNAWSPTPPKVNQIMQPTLPFTTPAISMRFPASSSPNEQYFDKFVSKWELEEKKWVL